MNIHPIIEALVQEFESHQDSGRAKQMEKYMRNQFSFYGIQSATRKSILRSISSIHPMPEHPIPLLYELWNKPQRELQYCAQELATNWKCYKLSDSTKFYLELITQKSWWDTVDYLATNGVGAALMNDSQQQQTIMIDWAHSNNLWVRRVAIIHQLKYNLKTQKDLLASTITPNLNDPDFFIQKAIGWALRQYGKHNPNWVLAFAKSHELSNLAKREGLRLL